MHVFLLAEREPPDAKLQLGLDSVGALHGLRRISPEIGQLDSRDGALALVTRLFVLEIRSGSLVGLVSDVVGPVLRTAETRVDLERINLMSRRDSLVQFR